MLELLLEPFSYDYMFKAIALSGVIGAVCACLSAYLMLKSWSLVGDALSHAVVPGVALAYAFSLPYAVGAFFAGFLASIAILAVKSVTKLREEAVIGFIFSNGLFADRSFWSIVDFIRLNRRYHKFYRGVFQLFC